MNLYKVGYTLISVVYHRMLLYKRTDRLVEIGFLPTQCAYKGAGYACEVNHPYECKPEPKRLTPK